MGLLDPIPQPYRPKDTARDYDRSSVELRCDTCGASFQGQAWMLKTKKEVNCRNCWLDKQEEV